MPAWLVNTLNWLAVVTLLLGSLLLVNLAECRSRKERKPPEEGASMTFCQRARRIVVAVALAISAWQGLMAAYSAPAQMQPHIIAAACFSVVALITLGFDVWWETRPCR